MRCQGRSKDFIVLSLKSCHNVYLKSILVATVLMETFVWWMAPISMRVEWRCASMTSGGQCVMTIGITVTPQWFASSWDMHILEVSVLSVYVVNLISRSWDN